MARGNGGKRSARRIAQALIEGKSQQDAVVAGGYAQATARHSATDIVRRPQVQSALTEAFERCGLTMKKLAQPIVDGLDATRLVTTEAGTILTDHPDHPIRFQAFDRASRAYGFMPIPQEMPGAAPPGLHVTIKCATPKDERGLKDITPLISKPPVEIVIKRQEDLTGNGRRRAPS